MKIRGFYRSFTARYGVGLMACNDPFPSKVHALSAAGRGMCRGMLIAALSLAAALVVAPADPAEARACTSVRVIDGDTLVCGAEHMRLQGIDSPEVPGHCRVGRVCAPGDPAAATANLRRLVARGRVECRGLARDTYGRTIARCDAGGDLSCAQLRGGFAIRRYAAIRCP